MSCPTTAANGVSITTIQAFFDAQDAIDRRREQLINEIERKLQQKVISEQLFATRWKVGWGLKSGSVCPFVVVYYSSQLTSTACSIREFLNFPVATGLLLSYFNKHD